MSVPARTVLASLLALAFHLPAAAQDSPKKDEPPVDVKYLFPATGLKPNTYGFMGGRGQGDVLIVCPLRVEKVIDDKRMTVTLWEQPNSPLVMVVNRNTKGIADGTVIDIDDKDITQYRVVGTVKYGGKTIYSVEPYTPPKKK